jgi:hypothetical protein
MKRHNLLYRLLTVLLLGLLTSTAMPQAFTLAAEDTATPTEIPTEVATETPANTPIPETATSTEVPTTATTDTPVPTKTPKPDTATPTPSTSAITVVSHLCGQEITATTDLTALDWAHQLVACPSLVLPADAASIPDGHVSATDPDQPLPFALTLDSADLAGADLTEASACESTLGTNLNGVSTDDRCWDLSGYAWSALPTATHELTIATPPASYTFGTALTDPASDDTIGSVSSSTVAVDTSTDSAVTVHLFYLPTPVTNQVAVIVHLCPPSITSRAAFAALSDFGTQLTTCPSIVLPGNSPAPGGVTSGTQSFTITVQGSDLTTQSITSALFAQHLVCEADRPADLNGDPADNLCFDLSAYVVPNVLQGSPVTIKATTPPAGTRYVGIAFDPATTDATTFLSAGSTGTIKLNTTSSGLTTLHYFVAPIPPTPTPSPTTPPTKTPSPTKSPTSSPTPPGPTRTPTNRPKLTATPRTPVPTSTRSATSEPTAAASATATPGGSVGTLHLFKRYCLGDESLTRINALAPGVAPGQEDYGDATCTYSNSQFNLYDADGNLLRTLMVPAIGNLLVENLPVTSGGRGYRIEDTRSLATGTFQISTGQTTNVLSLHYQADDDIEDPVPTFSDDGPAYIDPTAAVDGGNPDANYTPVDPDNVPNFGQEAGPSGSDPFVVDDDPEAIARVENIDAFDDMPGVGTGPTQRPADSDTHRMLIALALVALVIGSVGLYWRRRSGQR